MKTKKVRLVQLEDIMGRKLRKAVRDENGNVIREKVTDENGLQLTEVVRDKDGNALGIQPIWRTKTVEMSAEDCLPEMLLQFYLNIPVEVFYREDSLKGHRLSENIRESKKAANGVLELDEDVHEWLRNKMKEMFPKEKREVGVIVLGSNLPVIENALDDFERPKEAKEKGKEE